MERDDLLFPPTLAAHAPSLLTYTFPPQKLRGQQHILQRLTADDLRLPYSPHVVQQALADERLTLFQFAKYGTLKSVLHRHGDPNAGPAGQRPFPNRALVEIFRCCKFCLAVVGGVGIVHLVLVM